MSSALPTSGISSLPQAQGIQPNDQRFGEQWALNNTGQNGGQFGSDITVTGAWQQTTGSASTVIAVIDSGIDFTHPDLINNKWANRAPGPHGDLNGWDYITDSGTVIDEQGHGTAIAGIIAAQGNNQIGISGVMWQASLMSLRVLDNTGTGDIANRNRHEHHRQPPRVRDRGPGHRPRVIRPCAELLYRPAWLLA